MKNDTIAAIATALSDSGIGIIRISGERAITVGNKIFRTPDGKQILEQAESHTIHYGYIVDINLLLQQDEWKNFILDEVLVSVMRAPKSYTAEDTVEINCHGGVLVLHRLLELVCKNGARLAEPGEFTKRAFLNGRIDLSKAEAVIDIIRSRNDYALKASVSQLQGRLSDKVRNLRKEIIYEIAFIESALDDPEHISLEGYPERLSEKIQSLQEEVKNLIFTADRGKLMKQGISTVILGKPNAGKSSLLNLLLGEDRAIVTEIAGTTRDTLQESIMFHGISLNISDTAGIRDTEDEVEKIGVERAKKHAENADLILFVIDSSSVLDENDREIFSLIGEKKAVILLNKTDLRIQTDEAAVYDFMEKEGISCENASLLQISVKDNTGIDALEDIIKNMFFGGMLQSNTEIMITSKRHLEALQDAASSLALVQKSIEDSMPEDFYSIDFMSAYASLGRIIGEEVEDDLVEEIFGRFCMGK